MWWKFLREKRVDSLGECPKYSACSAFVLLDVVLNEWEVFGLLAVVRDGNRRGGLDLARSTLLVVLAVAEPFSEFSARLNLNQGNSVSLGQSLFCFTQIIRLVRGSDIADWGSINRGRVTYGDELLVLGIFAILGEDAANSLLAIQSLADFVETLNKSYYKLKSQRKRGVRFKLIQSNSHQSSCLLPPLTNKHSLFLFFLECLQVENLRVFAKRKG